MEPITHFLTGAVTEPRRLQSQNGAGYPDDDPRGRGSRLDVLTLLKGSIRSFRASSRHYSYICWSPVHCSIDDRARLDYPSHPMRSPKKSRPGSSDFAGTAIPRECVGDFCICVRTYRWIQSHSSRLHEQLRYASIRAVLVPVVLVGHRLHLRTASLRRLDRRTRTCLRCSDS